MLDVYSDGGVLWVHVQGPQPLLVCGGRQCGQHHPQTGPVSPGGLHPRGGNTTVSEVGGLKYLSEKNDNHSHI